MLVNFKCLLFYYALVHPHLLYALPVWGCTFLSYLRKLQCLQNKAIRIIFNSNRLTSVTPIFHALEIFNIEDLFKYEVYIYIAIKVNIKSTLIENFNGFYMW